MINDFFGMVSGVDEVPVVGGLGALLLIVYQRIVSNREYFAIELRRVEDKIDRLQRTIDDIKENQKST